MNFEQGPWRAASTRACLLLGPPDYNQEGGSRDVPTVQMHGFDSGRPGGSWEYPACLCVWKEGGTEIQQEHLKCYWRVLVCAQGACYGNRLRSKRRGVITGAYWAVSGCY